MTPTITDTIPNRKISIGLKGFKEITYFIIQVSSYKIFQKKIEMNLREDYRSGEKHRRRILYKLRTQNITFIAQVCVLGGKSALGSHLKLIILFLLLGFLILLHQVLTWGTWFQINDLHHETFALICFTMALGIYIGKKLE